MSRVSLLWVDLQRTFLCRYEQELIERGFDVDFVEDVDEAVRLAREPGKTYALVIWEMALAPGQTFDSRRFEIHGGMETGKYFQELIRREFPSMKTLLFTWRREIAPDWNRNHDGEYALAKRDYDPVRFATMVMRIIT